MGKPLGEWTLAELGKFCREQTEPCPKCPFLYICEMSPDVWDFTPKPKYTEDEVALAKLLLKAGLVDVSEAPIPSLVLLGANGSYGVMWLPKAAFPSVRPGETVLLRDIVGSVQEGRNHD